MSPRLLNRSAIPAYHSAKLIVKMTPAAAGPVRAFAAPMAAAAMAAAAMPLTPGFSTLAKFVKAGLIKQVVPLARQIEVAPAIAGARGMIAHMAAGLAGIAAAGAPAPKPDANAGVSILELEDDGHVEELRAAFSHDPTVEFAARVPVRYLLVRAPARKEKKKRGGATVAANPPASSAMWNLQKIQWEAARALTGFTDAAQVKVAVLDSGVDEQHPDLRTRVVENRYRYSNVPAISGAKDYIGHGTHVAGTIVANNENDVGISGICQCQLTSMKIFDDEPDFWEEAGYYVYFVNEKMYHRALADCLDEGINVINLSIGGGGAPDPNEALLFEQLIEAGTTVVAAMGNERERGSPTSYPAAIPGVIAVGATTITDQVATFSNRGEHISLSAPGDTIWSTLPTYAGQTGFWAERDASGKPRTGAPQKRDVDYAAWDGTSMASPHVAAAAALLLAKHGQLSPEEVRRRLRASADRLPAMGDKKQTPDYGTGRLNLLKLLSAP